MKSVFVLFGATGDLAKRKIYPALKEIANTINFDIIAIGRHDLTTQEYLERHISIEEKDIFNLITYKKINNSKEELSKLILETKDYEEIIFYLATPPKAFYEIIESFSECDLKNKKYKIVFEKPFGQDLNSFKELNNIVSKAFSEEQVYRVDHYLGKEGVIEILKFRKKGEYEKYWNSEYIQNVEIIVKENIGIEKRAGYYEEMGAIKDMIQNHLLQILTFVLIDLSDDERAEKIKLLEKITVIGESVLGQYASYTKEEKVDSKSKTETFAKIKLKVDSPRWKNTSISLITGKKLDKKETKIVINFIEKEGLPKRIIFEVYPKEKICFEEKDSYCKFEKEKIKEAYINIIDGIFKNKKEIFPSEKGLEASWKIVDKIKKDKLVIYSDGANEKEII
jgi:glucose-6-phosphate 1-dehydrogenase